MKVSFGRVRIWWQAHGWAAMLIASLALAILAYLQYGDETRAAEADRKARDAQVVNYEQCKRSRLLAPKLLYLYQYADANAYLPGIQRALTSDELALAKSTIPKKCVNPLPAKAPSKKPQK